MDTFTPKLRTLSFGIFAISLLELTGCTALNGLQGIPVSRVPASVLCRPREDAQQISISRLRQDPPVAYQLGPADVLGIYIENVLGEEGENPPVHFPEDGDQPPALGFPVPIREDGTIQLPYIEGLKISGLTVPQASQAIRDEYVRKQILQPEQSKIIVTLMRRREVRVTVIREEGGGQNGVTKRGTGQTVDLPAYENDVLHALNETGGFPGLDAKNEILVIKGGYESGAERDQMISMMLTYREPNQCPPELPDPEGSVRIPIRFFPETPPSFTKEDVILENGDIVYIPARDTDRFYTGGVLPGGEHFLPRDYSLDILGAIAVAGGPVGSGGTGIGQVGGGGIGGGGRGGGGGGTGCGPSDLIVLRKLPCGGEIPIKINLNDALQDPSQRILVCPGDTLILRYTLQEEILNSARQLLQFNFLFSGFSGGGF